MSVIAIDVALRHLNTDEEDQPHVQLLLDAAEDSAVQFLQRRFYADAQTLADAVLSGDAGDDPIVITPSIVAGCLLILGHLFANREDVVTGTIATQLPMGSRALLGPYRVGMGV